MNWKNEKYAELVASGSSPRAAYAAVYKVEPESEAAYKGTARMSKNVQVKERIAAIRKEAQEAGGGAIADAKEVMEFFTAVMRTPVGAVHPHHPLAEKIKVSRPWSKKGQALGEQQEELWVTEEVSIGSKIAAANALAEIHGIKKGLPEQAVDALASLMQKIAAGA